MTNSVGVVDYVETLLYADKTHTNTERTSQMFENSPYFREITADLFQAPLEIDSEEILESHVVKLKIYYAAEK